MSETNNYPITDASQHRLLKARRWVIKLGSSLVTQNGLGVDPIAISDWARQIAHLMEQGIEVVIVSSGAVAEGIRRLGWPSRPQALHQLQAAAAVGQMGVIQCYEQAFQRWQLRTAQILLTHEDLANRTRYLNARQTTLTLLDCSVIPVINENDSVVTDEICFGDNDTLAALVTNLVAAQVLVILTDKPGLYTADPHEDPNAVLVGEIKTDHPQVLQMASGRSTSGLGRGGMITKITAAKTAARSGAMTVIASGREPDVLMRLGAAENNLGTRLIPDQEPQAARKNWLLGQMKVRGSITIDEGAAKSLSERGASLLSVGVKSITGDFQRGDAVHILNVTGARLGVGLVNYSAVEANKIKGISSQRIAELLGYVSELELIHRDNLALII
ncbi:MAG: glutamate 5-kinase [Pseudomonadota bacterium]